MEAQTHLAKLLAGEVDGRGKVRRHRAGAEVQLLDAALLARIDYWRQIFRTQNERGPLERAYEEVRKEIGRSKVHVEREYKAAAGRRQLGWPLKLVATEKSLDEAYWHLWVGRRVMVP